MRRTVTVNNQGEVVIAFNDPNGDLVVMPPLDPSELTTIITFGVKELIELGGADSDGKLRFVDGAGDVGIICEVTETFRKRYMK